MYRDNICGCCSNSMCGIHAEERKSTLCYRIITVNDKQEYTINNPSIGHDHEKENNNYLSSFCQHVTYGTTGPRIDMR